ncbi:sensor histidine kinase [Shewanella sp. HN-41]|uniref:sensor histidine kinase n=1 Tax=Shewanella sp. HN-41 TaxID=327275 RepID=UPI000212635A|nr:ATP-binding protein [Shewanella sp. HN-41]EGM71573.1 sensor histidine kinase [Shewanella sp. HN-41]
MKFQFYRLFIFLLLSCGLVIWSFGELAEHFADDEYSYQIDVDDLLQTYDEQKTANIKRVTRDSLSLPDNLRALLIQGETLALRHSGDELYYYHLDKDKSHILVLGPVMAHPPKETNTSLILLGFYSSLSLVALWLIWPVFRDLHHLQQAAIHFGKSPQKLPLDTHRHSAIYPLAKVFNSVSHQMIDFVQMHKELSRTISHEVRTPLARMRFALELIKGQIDPSYAKRLNDDIDEIEQLAANYLSFARLEHREQNLSQELQSVDLFMAKMEQKYAIYQPKIKIRFEYQAQHARFDPATMTIALQNLIQNAMRFATHEIHVYFAQEDGQNRISVEDDGPGFEGKGKQLFAAFERDHLQCDSSGFGLGLYIVKKIATWHHGKLELSRSAHLGGAEISIIWGDTPLELTE